jgi:hypothetical protein
MNQKKQSPHAPEAAEMSVPFGAVVSAGRTSLSSKKGCSTPASQPPHAPGSTSPRRSLSLLRQSTRSATRASERKRMLIDDSHSNRKTVPELTRAGRGRGEGRPRPAFAPGGPRGVGCESYLAAGATGFQSNSAWVACAAPFGKNVRAPPPGAKRTRRVPFPVLSGHAAFLPQY